MAKVDDPTYPTLSHTVLDCTDARAPAEFYRRLLGLAYRALACGATLLLDRSDDPHEPLRVYRDPAGHPFCLFVGHPPDDRPAG